MSNTCNDQLKFISLSEVSSKTTLGKSTILVWEAQGKFPRATRLCRTKRVWLASDVNDWIRQQYELSHQPLEA